MKRILALVLVAALCFSLCACGGNASGGEAAGVSSNGIFKAVATETNPTVMGTYYRNVVGQNFNVDSDAVKEIDKKADEMLNKIENYPDTVKAKEGCKTYYISNNGNDANDGLTPETARATYLSVKGFLVAGDCVLFERGGLWRGQMSCIEGVSYGAYGEGAVKPRFYGSVDASKYGDGKWNETETAGVYVYSRVITDYSNIVFNNGEAIGRPVQKMEDITERELNVVYKSGKLYLYCPAGNPQDVYEVIEIAEGYTLVCGDNTGGENKNIHIQNLCIMFAGLHGIGSIGGSENLEIDGCVIGYIGGKNLYTGGTSIGNGIEMWGNVKGARIHDNYVFQCFDAALTHQSNSGMNFEAREEDIEYTNNLVEYNVYSFEAFVAYTEPHGDGGYIDSMGKVTISDNISRFAGWGWGYLDRPDKGVPADVKYRAAAHDEPLIVSNNVFDRSKSGVFRGNTADKSLMIFTNNTILQNPKRQLFDMAEKLSIGGDYVTFMNKFFADITGTTVTEVPNK